MHVTTLPYAATGAFSALVTDYLTQHAALKPFYHHFPTLEAFGGQIEEKQASYSAESRARLVASVQEQYQGTNLPPSVAANIALLAQPTTFTVTTGHQLNLFTGPLYFIYKIITTVKLSRQLKEKYPQHDFVPVYWMATEDHDFAEINHFQLFGKRHEWQTEKVGGPVGRMAVDGLEEQVLSQLSADVPAAFAEAYRKSSTLSEATRSLVTELFGEMGLVCLDADTPALKQALVPALEQEISAQASFKAVQATNEQLTNAGYKPQVYARPLNLFFLTDEGQRERIEPESDAFVVRNTELRYTTEELLTLARQQPECFSPNVVLRPLYQELLLPNLCYIGGGAEVAYWFQLKQVFADNKVPFPILLLRNSGLYISKPNAGKLRKLGLTATDLFQPLAELKKQVGSTVGQEEVSLKAQQDAMGGIFKEITDLAQRLDPTLVKTVAAEAQKAAAGLSNLEKRLIKAAENKHEIVFSQLTAVKDKLFPNGDLQERVENVLSIVINNPEFLQQLLDSFEPLALEFTVLEEE
ncbi:putative cysteine ligase BshC [Hymenobacter qilianensis]|uniref:Cysteine ligase BshC n=2 Tax=Hymenobacter qilianensis TaxID=1385715 RepID=A0ACB5PN29_9BACT|nr:bacillithiol biosynthesis cysteine-adding enzyme BshC [Hymenobacter qilianensis]QNP53572.1 bacillithiol biosynthesis cysteine-adding enzyme BshC [Hymenobacter qilianensis]GGF55075.1 putative cysteine ligase BshC [Hymenobacter qilianensis]